MEGGILIKSSPLWSPLICITLAAPFSWAKVMEKDEILLPHRVLHCRSKNFFGMRRLHQHVWQTDVFFHVRSVEGKGSSQMCHVRSLRGIQPGGSGLTSLNPWPVGMHRGPGALVQTWHFFSLFQNIGDLSLHGWRYKGIICMQKQTFLSYPQIIISEGEEKTLFLGEIFFFMNTNFDFALITCANGNFASLRKRSNTFSRIPSLFNLFELWFSIFFPKGKLRTMNERKSWKCFALR